MFLRRIFYTTVLANLVTATNTAMNLDEQNSSLHGTNNNYLRCGEIYLCSEGTFRYKSSDDTRPQRCVWLMAAPGAVKYAVKLEYPNDYWPSSSTSENLNYTGLLLSSIRYNSDEPISTPLFSTGVPIEFNANVLVLTFYSEASESLSPLTGFVFSFKAQQDLVPEAGITAEYSEYTLIGPDMPFRHPKNSNPLNGPVFGSVELSIIALVPRDNFANSSSNVKIIYKKLIAAEDIGCVYQSISVFSFKNEAKFVGFRNKGTFCEDITSFTQVTTDLTLIFVTSIRNASDIKRGFQLTYVD